MANEIGEQVREARESLGWSQEFLAAKVGTTQSTIDRIENGQTRRSRVLPEILAILELAAPLETKQALIAKPAGEFQRVDYVLPSSLVQAIKEYKNYIGVASEDEVVRRILQEFMMKKDTIRVVLENMLDKQKLLRSWRQTASVVLAGHPLIRTIQFDNVGGLYFEMDEEVDLRVTIKVWGAITVRKADGSFYKFAKKGRIEQLDPHCVAGEAETPDEIDF